MRHSQLKAFHHVALLGGFSRAAEALYLTQPAISEQVRKLEQDHDVLLFHRDRRRIRLTKAGTALFRLTRPYFEAEAQIADHLSQSGAAVSGELRIIADSAHHVTDILSRFRKRHPNVTVSLKAGNTGEIIEELRAYNAEIGVLGDAAPGSDMQVLNLGSADIVAFASRRFLPAKIKQLTMQELQNWPLIFREQGSKTRQKLEESAAKQSISLKPAITAEGSEAVREIVASGAGIGFISRAELGHDDRLKAYALDGDDLQMHESLVFISQRRDVRVIRAFMDVAQTAL